MTLIYNAVYSGLVTFSMYCPPVPISSSVFVKDHCKPHLLQMWLGKNKLSMQQQATVNKCWPISIIEVSS